MESFSGKLAVVTGGGSGMGCELVRLLAAAGCSVAACDWHPDAVAHTATAAQAGAADSVTPCGYGPGRYSSREHSFDAADGRIVSFRCHGAMVWPRYVASLVKPDLAISLKRE